MIIVVADTTPINYLVLIEQVELLPALFGQVIIPEAVLQELQATATPEIVKWWLTVLSYYPPMKLIVREGATKLGSLM